MSPHPNTTRVYSPHDLVLLWTVKTFKTVSPHPNTTRVYSTHHLVFLVDSKHLLIKHLKHDPRTGKHAACIRCVFSSFWGTVNI